MRFLIALMLALSAIAQPVPPLPNIVTPTVHGGTVLLGWNPGLPRLNSVSNVTTRSLLAAGYFHYYMVHNLQVGSTNSFVVFSSAGSTEVLTTVANAYADKCEISIHTYLIKVPAKTNGVTTILTSTNMVIWTEIDNVVNSGPTHQFVWTNDGGQRYFRSWSP